ncbi:MAG: beta-glucoside-specific PTS transporter subunit IIABC [Oscillospiraceae bacterium]|nr:beta-glucoside-specific PTS transporter subunit IIABC [Oscillospiraceae bacterium]
MMNEQELMKQMVSLAGGSENITSTRFQSGVMAVTVKDQSVVDLECIRRISGVSAAELSRGRLKIRLGSTPQAERMRGENSMDIKQLAQECVRLVGGGDNISTMTHCATRLRLQLVDRSKAQIKELEALDGVLGVKEVGIQTQIIIGPGVPKVYKEVEALVGPKAGANAETNVEEKGPLVGRLLDIVTGIFAPVINAITAGGMVKAALLIMVMFGLSNQSQEYYILNFIADSVFYFLPILLAFSSAQKFGCNQYIAAVVGGVMLHPNWNALVSAGDPVAFFHVPVTLWSYTSSVLPIILTVLFMSFVEKLAEKYVPTVVKAVVRPLLVLGITAPVALIVIGPLGSYLGKIFAIGLSFMDTHAPILVPTIVGIVCPLLIFVGMHLAIFPALQTVQLADMGYETVCGPGMLASNMAVAGATLAVAIKSKNAKTKELGLSTGVTALCGITEPALYGIITKFKRPLIAVMIGGGCGGLFAGIVHVKRYAFASPGIPALPTFIGDDPNNIYMAIATVAVSFVVAFIISWALADKEDGSKVQKEQTPAIATEPRTLYAPVGGNVISMEQIQDPVFSSGTLGTGCGINPDTGTICAPFNGEITMVADTKHAIGLMSEDGVEALIHVGLNTVELDGKGFQVFCQVGDKIACGQKLMTFDRKVIKDGGYLDTVVVLVTNADDFANVHLETTGKSGSLTKLLKAE